MHRGKVFLRDSKTKQWYAGPDRWAEAWTGAREFQKVEEAVAFGSGLGVEGLEVVVHFSSGEGDLVLPLRKKAS